jgi:hypothetical protein
MTIVVHQMDVKNVYLNIYLKDNTYMQQLKGYEKLGREHLVCKL